MKIFGLEKLSLVDFGNNVCAVVFTGACNYRCPFCHNAGLVEKTVEQIPENQVIEFLQSRRKMLDGVCVSGGEPTLQPDLCDFLRKLKQMGYKVKLDTNGTNPKILQQAINEKLVDYVAMDIKNSEDKYAVTTGVNYLLFSAVQESISILINSGVDYEFRTTLVNELHSHEDIKKMAQMLVGAKRIFLQQYIDSENCIKQGLTKVSKETAKEFANILSQTVKEVKLRGYS